MREGELKKLIVELIDSDYCKPLPREVQKIIDEAKKEFPPILKNRRGEPWVNPEKAATWFLKYLGEVE